MLALPSSLAPNPDPPNIGSLFQVLPRKMACVLGLKPKVERFRVVVVDENERLAGLKTLKGVENERMPLPGNYVTNIQ
jgi:hypothetical protein